MAELADAHDSKFEIYRFFCVRLRDANRALKLINKSSAAVELEFTQIARWGLEVAQNVAHRRTRLCFACVMPNGEQIPGAR